ncbi:MAG: hypothetical protein O6952_09940, partial [Planctomycetota bacterium]|nr:hypothetical protein [Planctomycetota bacterium]
QERLADPGEREALRVAAILSLHHYGNLGSLGVLMQIENRPGSPRLSSLARQAAAAIRQRSGVE